MNISYPNQNSVVYHQFIEHISQKVSVMMSWLSERNIDYVWNYWIGNHLYRLYIPSKDVLLDFEWYPVSDINYNYIRINYDSDEIAILQKLFPENIFDTQELDVWKLNQRAANRFLRDSGASPVYDKSALRLALVKDTEIYQCLVVLNGEVIRSITKQNCSVPYGTYILLRYLNEVFGEDVTEIKVDTGNSYDNLMYQILNVPVVNKSSKRKIWWNPQGTKWRINKKDTDKYVPFYLTETVTYRYPR